MAFSTAKVNVKGNNAGPSPLACLECRRKHLKCDAKQPCSRCVAADMEGQCHFISSRRGYQGDSAARRKLRVRDSRESEESSPQFTGHREDFTTFPTPPSSLLSNSFMPAIEDDGLMTECANRITNHGCFAGMLFNDSFPGPEPSLNPWLPCSPLPWPETNVDRALQASHATAPRKDPKNVRVFELYYLYFHHAHPCILPRRFVEQATDFPEYLEAVIAFVGSQYCPNENSEEYRCKAHASLAVTDHKSFYRVQALVLLSITLHARNEQQDALSVVAAAVDLALELGMHKKEFLEKHQDKSPIVLETIRRTWWELYIVDGMLAALHQFPDFRTNKVGADMELPCEEVEFDSGCRNDAPRHTPSDLLNRAFADDDVELSSFSHRIEAVQILSRVLAVASAGLDATNEVESIDSLLASWKHLLSNSKSEIVSHEGTVDEMLFQAHMIIHCSTIYLHLPRSGMIAAAPRRMENECASRVGGCAPTSTAHDHSVKATKAANAMSTLASLRTDVNKHTPFFICSLVMGAVVQLSGCSVSACKCLNPNRDRIVQAIALLRSLGKIWPIAHQVLQQVRRVAAELLRTGTRAEPKNPSAASTVRSVEDIIDRGLDVESADGGASLNALDMAPSPSLEGII